MPDDRSESVGPIRRESTPSDTAAGAPARTRVSMSSPSAVRGSFLATSPFAWRSRHSSSDSCSDSSKQPPTEKRMMARLNSLKQITNSAAFRSSIGDPNLQMSAASMADLDTALQELSTLSASDM
eukprot:1653038-Prymnesium_polylepis.1